LPEGGGALIARLFLPFATAVANGPEQDAEPMREAVREMQAKLAAEDERQVERLRAALGDLGDLP
jgi:hypothetical protein